MLETPDEVFARPGTYERVIEVGAGLVMMILPPGPSRPELLALLER